MRRTVEKSGIKFLYNFRRARYTDTDGSKQAVCCARSHFRRLLDQGQTEKVQKIANRKVGVSNKEVRKCRRGMTMGENIITDGFDCDAFVFVHSGMMRSCTRRERRAKRNVTARGSSSATPIHMYTTRSHLKIIVACLDLCSLCYVGQCCW